MNKLDLESVLETMRSLGLFTCIKAYIVIKAILLSYRPIALIFQYRYFHPNG